MGFPGDASGKEPACQCRRHKRLQIRSLGWEFPLEEDTATHSSIPACRIPWTEKPCGLQSIQSQRVECDLQQWHSGAGRGPVPLGVSISFQDLGVSVLCHWGVGCQSICPCKRATSLFPEVWACLRLSPLRGPWVCPLGGGLCPKAWAQPCHCPVSARCSGWGPLWGLPWLPSSTSTCSSPTP